MGSTHILGPTELLGLTTFHPTELLYWSSSFGVYGILEESIDGRIQSNSAIGVINARN
jgi:hypothetical protein